MPFQYEHDARHTFVLDFETRCALPLEEVGAHNYLRHESFRPLILAGRIGGERVLWECHKGNVPDMIRNLAADKLVSFASHGDFDRLVWKRLVEQGVLPPVHDLRWRDIMAIARNRNLPANLAGLAKALGLSTQKLESGKSGIAKFSFPQRRSKTDSPGEIRFVDPKDAPDDWAQFVAYAAADVDAAWEALVTLGFVSFDEEAAFRATRAMNDRGIPFSEERLRLIDRRAAEMQGMAEEQLRKLTGINPGNPNAFRDWLNAEAHLGVETVRAQELAEAVEDNVLPEHVKRAIELRGVVGAKALAKTTAALDLGVPDPGAPGIIRVRDQFVYAGASMTQRWAARGTQPQNFKRTKLKGAEAEAAWEALAANPAIDADDLPGELARMSQLMRSTITSPAGIAWTDLSNIELRVGALFCAQVVKANGGKLKGVADLEAQFRNGVDIYSHFAVNISDAVADSLPLDQRIVVTPENAKDNGWRATAKAVLLSSLFMVGRQTLQRNLRRDTGFEYSDEQAAGLHDAFRSSYPQFPKAWDFLRRGFLHVLRHGEGIVLPGFGSLDVEGKHMVLNKLSGSRLWYRNARVERYTIRGYQKHGFAFDGVKGSGVSAEYPHAGTLLEHLVSSTSRDLVADAMVKAERSGLRLIMSVHDELVVEGGKDASAELHRIMGDPPEWARAWPLGRESTYAKAWGK